MNERDKTAQMMQDSAGNSWGTEAHFQAFADLIRADAMEAATRAANVSWSLVCKKMVEDVVAYHSDGTRTVRIAPKRPWVGLTDEDIAYAYTLEKKFAMQYVDAKLKEKNFD